MGELEVVLKDATLFYASNIFHHCAQLLLVSMQES
jgi:hypothetical protein